jgi:hypothetical protein
MGISKNGFKQLRPNVPFVVFIQKSGKKNMFMKEVSAVLYTTWSLNVVRVPLHNDGPGPRGCLGQPQFFNERIPHGCQMPFMTIFGTNVFPNRRGTNRNGWDDPKSCSRERGGGGDDRWDLSCGIWE